MNGQLRDKVLIVTGGGRGLGRAMALGFARAGAAGVVVTAARSREQIASAAEEIDGIASAGTALALSADVTSWADCVRVARETIARFGRIDALVNNAGKGQRILGDDRIPFWQAQPDGWRAIIDTNINGPFLMTRAVVDHIMQRRRGRVINISKSRDSMHRPLNSPYGPSKAALEAMTLAWAQDLIDTGVTVNSLAPGGSVDTEFVQPATRARAAGTGKTYFPPEIIVPAAVWLASDRSDGITGCRYIGSRWDDSLPPDEAAETAREPAIFLPPGRDAILTKPWEPPGCA